jgi:1-acyl-sn-glycerol-3-phosphate acyltransferase
MFRYRLIRFLLTIVQIILSRLVVYGRQNIPPAGPYIVAVNHMSVADTPILLISFPIIRWRFFAGEKWRSHWLYGPIMAWLGAIYINRGAVDRAALKEALAALEAGHVFGLAPEGSRSQEGYMLEARGGVAYLASRANVPILPVGLVNTDVLFANARRLRRTQLEAHIGRLFTLPELGRRPRAQDMDAYTHYIMVHIAAQLPPRYHGIYADSVALAALLAGEDPWPYCQTAVKREA